ncbi:MAG: porin family protein [Bacteroidales bacterium]|nr:porin family protein [Bacteroidales bacterium]MDD4216899.1 porin family protein [Bacteroidales bacterium]MDY0140577.1 porin family protein [Bacteroidales bacterium]
MKKIIVCVFTLILVGNVFAQKISGGLFIGPTMSWMSTDSKPITTEGLKFGYNFGALLDFNIVDNFAISTGIQFNKLGGNINFIHGADSIISDEDIVYNDFTAGSSINYNLNYLAIPVGFKGKTNEIGYLTYFLKAGVTPLINIKTLATFGSEENILLSDEISLFNVGWHIGGGAEYSLSGNTRILFEIIYTGGLLDVDNTEVFTTVDMDKKTNPKIILNDIHLKVGILF